MKDVKMGEKEKLSELQTKLYDQQRQMAHEQNEIEKISARIQKMDQEFENEINI